MTTHEIQYDDKIPPPVGNRAITGELARLREAIMHCPANQSFLYPGNNKMIYCAAKQVNCKITVRKIDGNGYRIWRLE